MTPVEPVTMSEDREVYIYHGWGWSLGRNKMGHTRSLVPKESLCGKHWVIPDQVRLLCQYPRLFN